MGLGESLALITPQLIEQFGNTITINTVTFAYNDDLEPEYTIVDTVTDKAIVDNYVKFGARQTDGAPVDTSSITLYTYYNLDKSNQIEYESTTYKIDDVVKYPVSNIGVLYVVEVSIL